MIKFRKQIIKNRNPRLNSKIIIPWESRFNDKSTGINFDK